MKVLPVFKTPDGMLHSIFYKYSTPTHLHMYVCTYTHRSFIVVIVLIVRIFLMGFSGLILVTYVKFLWEFIRSEMLRFNQASVSACQYLPNLTTKIHNSIAVKQQIYWIFWHLPIQRRPITIYETLQLYRKAFSQFH